MVSPRVAETEVSRCCRHTSGPFPQQLRKSLRLPSVQDRFHKMSGARQVQREQPADVGIRNALLLRKVGDRLSLRRERRASRPGAGLARMRADGRPPIIARIAAMVSDVWEADPLIERRLSGSFRFAVDGAAEGTEACGDAWERAAELERAGNESGLSLLSVPRS